MNMMKMRIAFAISGLMFLGAATRAAQNTLDGNLERQSAQAAVRFERLALGRGAPEAVLAQANPASSSAFSGRGLAPAGSAGLGAAAGVPVPSRGDQEAEHPDGLKMFFRALASPFLMAGGAFAGLVTGFDAGALPAAETLLADHPLITFPVALVAGVLGAAAGAVVGAVEAPVRWIRGESLEWRRIGDNRMKTLWREG